MVPKFFWFPVSPLEVALNPIAVLKALSAEGAGNVSNRIAKPKKDRFSCQNLPGRNFSWKSAA